MSIHVHELKQLKMYNASNKLFIPLDDKDNKKHSAIYLLTPNIESSIKMINSNTIINRGWFKSYYIEKSLNTILSTENYMIDIVNSSDDFVDRVNMLLEDKLPSKERNELDTKEFGIPNKRKYPLNDEEHVRAAIRMFNHVSQEDEATLAKNIIKKLKKFEITDIDVGEDNRFYKYYHSVKELKVHDGDMFQSYSYYKTSEIKKEIVDCNTEFNRYHNCLRDLYSTNVKYLGKVYSDENLIGFLIGYKESDTKIKAVLYMIYDKSNKDDIEDAARILITNFQGIMINRTLDTTYQYATVWSYDKDKVLIRNMAISFGTFIKDKFGLIPQSSNKNEYFVIPLNITRNEECKIPYTTVDEVGMTAAGLKSRNSLMIFDDFFNEDTQSVNDQRLKKILYPERIRNQKEVINIYNIIKDQCPSITNTKISYKMYKGLNLYIDTSYYNKSFFDNNKFTSDKGILLYLDLVKRLLSNSELNANGYTRKSIFVPVSDWYSKDEEIFDYKNSINPISAIIRLIRLNKLDEIKKVFGGIDVIFFGEVSYFKVNFDKFEKKFLTKFTTNIRNIINKIATPEENEIVKDTPDAIVTDIVDKLEKSQHIQLYAFTSEKKQKENKFKTSVKPGEIKKEKDPKTISPEPVSVKKLDTSTKKTSSSTSTKTEEKPAANTAAKTEKEAVKKNTDEKKEKVIAAIADVAATSTSVEDALDKLDQDSYVADIIKDIADEESSTVKVSAARESRISNLNKDLQSKSVKGKSVKELIEKSEEVLEDEELPTTSININTINTDQWENLQYINFNKVYDVDEDIMSILNFFSTRSVPVGIRNVDVQDTSTSEDLVETWTVQCEDIYGTRFQLKFDIPKFKGNRFMRLRGNDKTINGQLMNLPIIKTEKDVCQITTNYNKIFFRVFGSSLGKSNVYADKCVKCLNKYEGKSISYKIGSNKLGALKYDLPIDYIDMSNYYSTITYKNVTFYFNQDEIREKYADIIDLKFGIPIAYNSSTKEILYHNANTGFMMKTVVDHLRQDPEFDRLYNEAKPSVRYSYSKASIMSTTIPVIVVAAYCEGLTQTLNKAGINYSFTDKKPKVDPALRDMQDTIRFSDGYLNYDVNYSSSLLMNGLKECNTEDYSIKDIDTKSMWTEMLDLFGGRIKADGLDNFYDLMFDPISIRTCEAYNLPSGFCEALIYASNLLTDSKFNKHVDITGNRFRTNELVAGYTYKALSKSYADYHTLLKKTGKASMSIKQSAVIDAILTDNTTSDASTINDLCYAEAVNTVSWKGLSGLNSERSYSLDKRTYDGSMNGMLAMSTGFAGTVGETRQTTVNMNISGKRGYIKDNSDNKEDMNDVNTMCVSECLTPLSTTHDDPFREAMSFTQRTKHDMRVAGGDPLLITNGMDDALSNFTPDYFSVNAKSQGKVVEVTPEHIVVQYKDGTVDFVELRNKVYKNSDGGFYTAIKLDCDVKQGQTVKPGDIIAHDPLSYTRDIGYDNNPTYNQGTIAKVAIITTDKGFEDSCVVDRYLSNALSSNVVTQVPVTLPKNTNVYDLVKIGQQVQEGEPLMVIQNAFEDDDVNILLKNLVDDEDTVTSLGRIPIKSHNTGVVEDIMIYRTVEIDELSPSLKKIVTDYEREKSRIRKNIEKYDPDKAKEYVNDYKLDSSGKLKNIDEGVLIEIYISYKDDFSIGDKLIVLGAQKGVAKDVFEVGKEPRSSYRPDEPINCMVSMVSFDKRMITAPLQYCLAYKGLIELDRQVKDIMGIKQDYTIEHPDLIPKE